MSPIVRGRWYPAAVKFSDEPQAWSRCLVIAADDGLHVYRERTEESTWHSAIIWDATTLPTDRQARRGFDVNTEAGLVVITLGSGCRCGPMGRWPGPAWASAEVMAG